MTPMATRTGGGSHPVIDRIAQEEDRGEHERDARDRGEQLHADEGFPVDRDLREARARARGPWRRLAARRPWWRRRWRRVGPGLKRGHRRRRDEAHLPAALRSHVARRFARRLRDRRDRGGVTSGGGVTTGGFATTGSSGLGSASAGLASASGALTPSRRSWRNRSVSVSSSRCWRATSCSSARHARAEAQDERNADQDQYPEQKHQMLAFLCRCSSRRGLGSVSVA